jgi:hypothetical protein
MSRRFPDVLPRCRTAVWSKMCLTWVLVVASGMYHYIRPRCRLDLVTWSNPLCQIYNLELPLILIVNGVPESGRSFLKRSGYEPPHPRNRVKLHGFRLGPQTRQRLLIWKSVLHLLFDGVSERTLSSSTLWLSRRSGSDKCTFEPVSSLELCKRGYASSEVVLRAIPSTTSFSCHAVSPP